MKVDELSNHGGRQASGLRNRDQISPAADQARPVPTVATTDSRQTYYPDA